jgi:hypothetical protein
MPGGIDPVGASGTSSPGSRGPSRRHPRLQSLDTLGSAAALSHASRAEVEGLGTIRFKPITSSLCSVSGSPAGWPGSSGRPARGDRSRHSACCTVGCLRGVASFLAPPIEGRCRSGLWLRRCASARTRHRGGELLAWGGRVRPAVLGPVGRGSADAVQVCGCVAAPAAGAAMEIATPSQPGSIHTAATNLDGRCFELRSRRRVQRPESAVAAVSSTGSPWGVLR